MAKASALAGAYSSPDSASITRAHDALRFFRRLLDHGFQLDRDQPRGVLGPLDIAAHPVEAVGDAAQHLLTLNTQVSFEPPPWDGIDHQAAALQRHAGQRAGHDLGFRAMQDEGAQIDMARLRRRRRQRRARWKAGWSAGRCSFPDRPSSSRAKASRSACAGMRPDQHAVAAGFAHRLHHQLVEIGQHMAAAIFPRGRG